MDYLLSARQQSMLSPPKAHRCFEEQLETLLRSLLSPSVASFEGFVEKLVTALTK